MIHNCVLCKKRMKCYIKSHSCQLYNCKNKSCLFKEGLEKLSRYSLLSNNDDIFDIILIIPHKNKEYHIYINYLHDSALVLCDRKEIVKLKSDEINIKNIKKLKSRLDTYRIFQ